MFVESENDPTTDPVVVWTNGGPGAASYFGLMTEVGPLYLDGTSLTTEEYKSTGVPTLYRNENSWTKFSNLLIINSPSPVGYSYCDPAGVSGSGTSCGTHNDTRTAIHSATYLENWMIAYPEF